MGKRKDRHSKQEEEELGVKAYGGPTRSLSFEKGLSHFSCQNEWVLTGAI